MLREINDADFDKALSEASVVVVDFWAPWCGPCRMVGPFIEELAEDFEGQDVLIRKLNVDDNPVSSMQYQVSAIPSVLIFRQGELMHKIVGVRSKETYEDLISALL